MNQVLHDMRHFLLTESDAGVAEPDIFTIVFVRVVEIGLPLDIVTLALVK